MNEEKVYIENYMESIQARTKVLNTHRNIKFNS